MRGSTASRTDYIITGHLSEICLTDEALAILIAILQSDTHDMETLYAIVACEKYGQSRKSVSSRDCLLYA